MMPMTTSPTALHIHDAVRDLRRALGDDVAFDAVRCASATANTWRGPTDGSNRHPRYMQLALDLKHAGIEARARAAARSYAERMRVEVDWLNLLFGLVAHETSLIEVLEAERAAIGELLAELRRPALRAGAAPAS
jgi:hypothetical protein